jgi:hypothetical protein
VLILLKLSAPLQSSVLCEYLRHQSIRDLTCARYLQVLVPVALMQHDQSQVGQQAYMLVNREDLPLMAAQQPHLMGMPPNMEQGVQQKQPQEEDGLMDVLVGAAVQVEGDADEHNDNEGDTEDGDGTNSNKSLTTRSGRRRNPTRAY